MATTDAATTRRATSDLVWDGGLHATAFVDNGQPLIAGADVGWTPEVLMATATSASLMARIVERALDAGVEILGYVSEQRVAHSPVTGSAIIRLSPCITVGSRAAANTLHPIVSRALDGMLFPQMPGYELTIEPRVAVAQHCGGVSS